MGTSLTTWLIRHGESDVNAGQKSSDPTNITLTERSSQQAQAVARKILVRPTQIVVSSYKRPQQTADVLQERYPDCPVVEWPIHEFTYLTHDDYRGTTSEDRRCRIDQYWQNARPYDVLGPGAELFAQFLDRVIDVRNRLFAETNGPIAVFSHKKFLSALIWVLLAGVPKISSRRMHRYRGFDLGLSIKNDALILTELREGQVHVGPIDTAHLVDI